MNSRLIYFKPHATVTEIPQEEKFWKFIKHCFNQPRRTLRNNLSHTHYAMDKIDDTTLALRAQEMGMQDILKIWNLIKP